MHPDAEPTPADTPGNTTGETLGASDEAQLLAGVLDSSLDGIVAFASVRDASDRIVDFTFTYVNRKSEAIIGKNAAEMLGHNMLELLPGNKADGLFDAYASVVTTGKPFYTEHYYQHDGLNNWFSIMAAKCGDGFTVTFSDITERKATERQYCEAMDRLNEAQELACIGNWQWTPADDRIIWSNQTKRMFGVPLDEPAPDFDTHREQIHPDDRDFWQATVDQAMRDREPYAMRFRVVRPDGSVRVILARGRCDVGVDGRVARMYGTTQDVTEAEATRDQLEKLSLIASRTDNGVILTDAKGKVEWINNAFNTISGYTLDELKGKTPGHVLQGPDSDPETIAYMRQKVHAGQGYAVKLVNYHKTGRPYWIEIEAQPIRDAFGRLTNFMAVQRDVTAQHNHQLELEAQQQRLSFALQGSRTGLWDWQVDTGATYFSETWYTMLGYAPGELPMNVQSWMEITHPDDLASAKASLEAYFQGEAERYACEMRVRNKAGDWQWILDVGEAVERDPAGRVTRMVGLHVDIDNQKRTQRELEAARDQAQQANAAKSAFLANMSHEIRTPMNAILGYADLLLDGSQSEADRRYHAQTIRRNGKHLLGILNDILDLSKIEAGKLAIEGIACDTDDLFAEVMGLMKTKADERGIDLVFEAVGEIHTRIESDPTRIRQVLLNLLGNAIKFTERGEVRLRVSLQTLADRDATLRCDVIDTGIGITTRQMDKLFQPFSQADESTTRQYGGTGLGLAISTNIAKMLGGELTCTSTPNQGSTFTATFRAANQFRALMAYVRARGADPQRLVLFGESRGAIAALNLA
ncbi:MAG: PAS domain-containing sensor histidine kinase, partial [Phycisphaeraceae bacterium]